MSATIVMQYPRTRCWECGSPEINIVCHHCGRAMCGTHGPAHIPEGSGIENPEFTGLGLSDAVGEVGMHCKNCIHHIRSYGWLRTPGIYLALAGLVGSVIPWELRWVGILVLLAGLGLVATSVYLNWTRYQQAFRDSRPPLPIIGQVDSVDVSETLRGHIVLGADGIYNSRIDTQTGKLTCTLHFIPQDRERLSTYREKYALSEGSLVNIHAGFVLLNGTVRLVPDDLKMFMPEGVNTTALSGLARDHEFLAGDGRRNKTWTIRRTYTIPAQDRRGDELQLPFYFIPTLVQEGTHRAIELVLQLAPSEEHYNLLGELIAVEELSLFAPQELGQVDVVEPSAIISAAGSETQDDFRQSITWKNLDFVDVEAHERRKTFYIRFENPVQRTTTLSGRLRLRFDGTVSGLERVAIYFPLGNPRPDPNMRHQTYVDVRFDWDLGGLRFQEIEAVEETIERERVVPDYEMVARLTDAMNDRDLYVKRVIENPPRTSKAGAHIINRYWDVAGRFYNGVYPLDYHLVLTGEEVYISSAQPRAGTTQIEITVQGTVADEKMRGEVAQLRDELVAIINDTLDKLPQTEIPVGRLPEMPFEEGEREFEDEVIASPSPSLSQMTGAEERLRQLEARLDTLDDALLDGRISDERYDEMRTRIERQISELQQG